MITLQQYIVNWVQTLIAFLRNLWDRWTGQVLIFENARRSNANANANANTASSSRSSNTNSSSNKSISVRLSSKPIAEGGFSVVFAARDMSPPNRQYALKRIRCHDSESRRSCQQEIQLHYQLQEAQETNSKYLLSLYGHLWTSSSSSSSSSSAATSTPSSSSEFCWMLFPFMPHSLRAEVNHRIFPSEINNNNYNNNSKNPYASKVGPWPESIILQIFQHVLEGVARMHQAGFSHRDIKLENILCLSSSQKHLVQPILMDFGSAGPLTRSLSSRQDVLEIVEIASEHTTISYRPPELFPGELRSAGPNTATDSPEAVLDYSKVDVWSCGCLLFALMYGASPFESEFDRRLGEIKVVECSQLRVIGKIPQPPAEAPSSHWYSNELTSLVEFILSPDRHQRPSLDQVQTRLRLMLEQFHPHLVAPQIPKTQPLRAGGGMGPPAATSFGTSLEDDFFAADPFAGRSMTY